MKKFWDWMKDKKYITWGDDLDIYFIEMDCGTHLSKVPKQMIIGYMIEYLLSKENFKRIPADIYFNQMNINEFYVYLEKEISE